MLEPSETTHDKDQGIQFEDPPTSKEKVKAGLFSAVVTAFLVESQKSLRTDPIEAILLLMLTKIGEAQASQISSGVFSPPEDVSVRINTLWFLSLVLSLVTVLIGTVSLQWLREHQRPYADLEPQIAFSLHQMQMESLDKWWVPHIFTMLPLLLQAALILFLIGLNELLFNLNRTVAIWVAIAIGLALFFLGATTVLPTLQNLYLFLPWRMAAEPPSPCPYKSPQAWAFHRLLSPLVKAVMKAFGTNFAKYLKVDPANLTSKSGRVDWWESMPRGTKILFRNKGRDTWLEHSVAWLFQRDLDYMKLDAQDNDAARTLSRRPIPLYDAIQGILEAKHEAFSHTHFTAVDHCIASVVVANVMEMEKPYARFLHRLSLSQPLSFGLPPEFEPSPEDHNVLQEDATLRLFSRGTSFENFSPEAIEKCVEICVRLTAWMYGGQEVRKRPTTTRPYPDRAHQRLPIHLVAYALGKRPLDSEYTQQIRQQVRLIVLGFFERMGPCNYPPNDQAKSLDTNERRFLSHAAKILTSGDDSDICDEILDRIHIRPRDDVYQAAYVFCHAILARGVGSATPSSLRRFIKALYNYENLRNPPGSNRRAVGLRRLIFHPNEDWTKFIRRAQGLGIELDHADETVGDNDTSRSTLDDGVEQPSHTIVDILPPQSPA
ncbi:hypothetical protein EST38_g13081 [Candolleomyces aberdarensis]|uniref:DUF6535 domain-containing protein n=1 Tax=Candolleomyces aberdarensis TaxID=2316362 RepID=A0A4Q2D0U6_9AGAR|nr:hypothetical protein EST38_g13081 [Candolleomyces aberdarensis]